MNRRPSESRRSRRRPAPQVAAWVEMLESRTLLAAPVVAPIGDVSLPAGKTLFVPVQGSDADGDSLSYTVEGTSADVEVSVRTGRPFLEISVAGFGDMVFQLYDDLAPNTVEKFRGLVESNFYDGLTFHRIVPGFVIQGGDPEGDGTGGPGFQFDDEFHPDAIFTGDAQLAMANSGRDTNGSQFFITIGPERHLDFNHTIFGQLVRGRDVLTAINNGSPGAVITDAAIVANTTDTVLLIRAPVGTGSSTITVTARDSEGFSTSRSFAAQYAPDPAANNDPPILGPVGDQIAVAGFELVIPLTSIDLEGNPVEYSATIVDNPAAATVAVEGSNVIIRPTPGVLGTFSLRVGVRKQGATTPGSDRLDLQTVEVQVVPLTIVATGVPLSAVAGVATTGVVGRFTANEGEADDFSAIVAFDDGTTAAATIVANGQGGFDVRATHTYTTAGTFTIEVMITGPGGATARATTSATVAPLTIVATGVPLSAVAATPVTGVVGRFTANEGEADDFSAIVAFDDGTTAAATIVANGQGGFDVRATHTYTTAGTFTIEVMITGPGGATARAMTSATVAPQPGARLTIGLDTSAATAMVGQDLTYTVTISSTGVAPALRLSLTFLLPAGVTFISSTGAPTALSTGGDVVTIPLGDLAVGESRSLKIVVRPTAGGTIASTAFVTSSIDPTVAATRSTMTIVQGDGGTTTVNPESGPQVTDVSRQRNRTGRTRIDLTFGSALDPARAEDARNYALIAPGRDGRLGTRDDFRVPVAASYDAATRAVTLVPRSRRYPFASASLRIRSGGASGLTDTQGRPLDGDRDGLPGGEFRVRLGRADRPRRAPAIRAGMPLPAGPVGLFARSVPRVSH